MLFVCHESRGGGRVLPGGASLPYRTIGLLKKKFAEILEDRNLSGTDPVGNFAARLEGQIKMLIAF